MTVCIITANLGAFEAMRPSVQQVLDGVDVVCKVVTSTEMPPRKSLSLRLQAKLPKLFGWDMYPGYDQYVWIDASMRMVKSDAVRWFLDQLGSGDIAVFRHPFRLSIQQEVDYLRRGMARGPNREYLCKRYEGEDADGQMRAIAQPGFVDDRLYAAGAFCYRPTARVHTAMQEWWYHMSRFHCNDQLSLPFALWKAGCDVRVIDEHICHASRVARRRGRD